jgi:ribosome-associated toxin RatA of RatAB toxin-antitoxin module
MPEAQESIEVNVSPSSFFEVITDFDEYPRFLTEVSDCRVVNHDCGTYSVDYTIHVIKRIEYRLIFEAEPDTHLSWRLESPGKLMKENSGEWTLKALDGGERTHATYRLNVVPGVFVPKVVTQKLVSLTLPSLLQQFKKEAEMRAGV